MKENNASSWNHKGNGVQCHKNPTFPAIIEGYGGGIDVVACVSYPLSVGATIFQKRVLDD